MWNLCGYSAANGWSSYSEVGNCKHKDLNISIVKTQPEEEMEMIDLCDEEVLTQNIVAASCLLSLSATSCQLQCTKEFEK